MNRLEIYEALEAERPVIARHENTPRIMATTDALLDMLIDLQFQEELVGMDGAAV